MAVIKDATANFTAKIDTYGSMRMVLVGTDGSPAALTIGGSVEVANDSGNPLPVSGTVSVGNFPATQPVSGTFFQATQPVSGTVAVSNFPATQAVSGTFFQATQPVSLATLPALVASTATIGKVDQGVAGASSWAVSAAQSGAWSVAQSGTWSVAQNGAWTVAATQSGTWTVAGTGTFNVAGTVNASAYVGGAAVSAANPLNVQLSQGNAPLSATNPLFSADTFGGQPVAQSNPYPVIQAPVQAMAVAGAAAGALTVTIPAPAAGLTNYLTGLMIQRVTTTAASAAAIAPLTISTTNLPNSFSLRYAVPVTAVQSVETGLNLQFAAPLKSSAAATATTIVLPATNGTTTYWMVTVFYFVAP